MSAEIVQLKNRASLSVWDRYERKLARVPDQEYPVEAAMLDLALKEAVTDAENLIEKHREDCDHFRKHRVAEIKGALAELRMKLQRIEGNEG